MYVFCNIPIIPVVEASWALRL